MKILLLLVIVFFQNPIYANNLCTDYFRFKTIEHSLNQIFEESQSKNIPPEYWIDALRKINSDSESFPFAEQTRFGTYFSFERNQIPRYKRHLFFLLGYRGSHVDIPKKAPTTKQELANFLIHLSYAIEMHLSNRNSFSFPVQASQSYLTTQKNIEIRRKNRFLKLENKLESSDTPELQKTFIKIYLVYSKLKTALKIQWFEVELRSRIYSALPHNYAKDIEYILKEYNKDIQVLVSNLEFLLQKEFQAPEFREYNPSLGRIFLSGLLRTFFQPTFWQLQYWEPFRYSPLSTPSQGPILSAGILKYLVDSGMNIARFGLLTASLSIIIQSTTEVFLMDTLQKEIAQNIYEHQKQQSQIHDHQIQLYDEMIRTYEKKYENSQSESEKKQILSDLEILKNLRKQAIKEYEMREKSLTVNND